MIPVLTADEMRRADRFTVEEVGLPGVVLMENAGSAVATAVERRFPGARRVVIVCGKGNNGGDGFVVARRLQARGAVAVLVGRKDGVKGDARIHLEAAERSGVRVVEAPDAAAWGAASETVASADLLVDALLGTGLRSRPEGIVGEAVATLTARAAEGCPVVAVDIPSGAPSDGDFFDWPVPAAVLTVTFAAPKRGHVLPPACDFVGELLIVDIGIPRRALGGGGSLALIEDADAAAVFSPRAPGAHKGDFGRVLVVAGSRGKAGAAALAASGALRSGAGLVTVATPASCLGIVAAAGPELMTEPLPETGGGGLAEEGLERLLALAGERDAVVLGPGLGRDPSTWRLAREFAARCPVALVMDADGLNAIAPGGGGEGPASVLRRRQAGTVLTPHPGEMSRLRGWSVSRVQEMRVDAARSLARETGAVVVLKGQRTLVAEPGGRTAVTGAGNPGLATGGTGDVLAGVVGSLLGRCAAWTAATAAVHLHGRAGDLAARAGGEYGLIAGDVARTLPQAVLALRASAGGGASSGA